MTTLQESNYDVATSSFCSEKKKKKIGHMLGGSNSRDSVQQCLKSSGKKPETVTSSRI